MSAHGDYESRAFVARFYDHVPAYAGRADIPFYVDLAREARGDVLELGCGTGRVLIPTARAGIPIVGLDLSPHMLEICRERLAREPAEVRDRAKVVEGDMRDFRLGARFALITTPFRPFQHLLTTDDQLACLRSTNAHLAAGGRLVLDLFQVDPCRIHHPVFQNEEEDTPETPLPDGGTFRRTSRVAAFHRAQQVNDIELIYYVTHPDGREERLVQAFPFRYFFRYEVEHLLARTGFRVAALHGDFDRSPFGDDSPEMIFVAEKVGEA